MGGCGDDVKWDMDKGGIRRRFILQKKRKVSKYKYRRKKTRKHSVSSGVLRADMMLTKRNNKFTKGN